jgi:hypothetical protein
MEWKGEWGGEGKRGGLLDDLKAKSVNQLFVKLHQRRAK